MKRKVRNKPPGRAIFDDQLVQYRHRITTWLHAGMPVDVFDRDHTLIERWYPFPDQPAYDIVRAQNVRMGYPDGRLETFRYGTRLDEYFIVACFIKLNFRQHLAYRIERFIDRNFGPQALRQFLMQQYQPENTPSGFAGSLTDHDVSIYSSAD